MWPDLIPLVFPYYPRGNDERKNISDRFEEIKLIRNRLFHHEPIWKFRNAKTSEECIIELRRKFNDIFKIAGQITKNSSSRYIPLNDEAYKIIKQLYEKSDSKKGLVFLSKDNKPFNNIKRSWATILKKAQITDFRWHDLRHHFASKLVMAGIDLNTVRELLGHSDIKMTLRYAHLAPEHKIKAVNKINWTN